MSPRNGKQIMVFAVAGPAIAQMAWRLRALCGCTLATCAAPVRSQRVQQAVNLAEVEILTANPGRRDLVRAVLAVPRAEKKKRHDEEEEADASDAAADTDLPG